MKWVLPVFLFTSLTAPGQPYRKHNFEVRAGAGLPRGDLRQFFADAGGVGVSYYYRFLPYFAAELGYEGLFGAAGVRDFLSTPFGDIRIGDYQHFLPFGGRVIAPIFGDRIQLYGSGGGAYLRYSERVRQPFQQSGFKIDCPVCSLRDGVGYYAGAGVNVALDQAQHFRVGFTGKVYRGATAGDPLGSVPGRETIDRWINLFGTFSFSF